MRWLILSAVIALLMFPASSNAAVPSWWLAQAACIRSHEGGWTTNTGNGYYGAFQFTLSTWRANGGRGYPHQASPSEQTYRAYLNWRANGNRWGGGQWPTSARLCGLR